MGISLKARALRMLASREHSPFELRGKLARHSEDEKEIDAVIAWLTECGYLSEERFTDVFVRMREARHGTMKIVASLKNHRIADKEISKVKAVLKDTELPRAKALRERRFGEELPKDTNEKARQMRFLASRGFAFDVIERVFNPRD